MEMCLATMVFKTAEPADIRWDYQWATEPQGIISLKTFKGHEKLEQEPKTKVMQI